jgi:hypothetical protein
MYEHLLRKNFYANAQHILEKCGFTQEEARKLCHRYHLQIIKDLCRLTDVDILMIPWLGDIQTGHLHEVCAICRQIQLEKYEAKKAKKKKRLRKAALEKDEAKKKKRLRKAALENDEAKQKKRLRKAALSTPDTHIVYDPNADLRALLESLQGMSSATKPRTSA